LVIAYSAHAKQKLSIRRIERADVERTITSPTALFEDIEHGAKVAVKALNGRFLIVVYRAAGEDTKVITVYYTRKLKRLTLSKTERSAWRRLH
jgi:hypothetical protein